MVPYPLGDLHGPADLFGSISLGMESRSPRLDIRPWFHNLLYFTYRLRYGSFLRFLYCILCMMGYWSLWVYREQHFRKEQMPVKKRVALESG